MTMTANPTQSTADTRPARRPAERGGPTGLSVLLLFVAVFGTAGLLGLLTALL